MKRKDRRRAGGGYDMKWTECVIDATMGCQGGAFTFCPIDGDINGAFSVVTGMNFISSRPPEGMKLVAVIHADGNAAVEAFCKQYRNELAALKELHADGIQP